MAVKFGTMSTRKARLLAEGLTLVIAAADARLNETDDINETLELLGKKMIAEEVLVPLNAAVERASK